MCVTLSTAGVPFPVHVARNTQLPELLKPDICDIGTPLPLVPNFQLVNVNPSVLYAITHESAFVEFQEIDASP